MLASRGRPKGALRAPFGFGVLILLLLPSELGYQDLAGLIARQSQISERSQKAAFVVSAFGTIHEQRFSLPQPVGASIPPSLGFTLAGFDPNASDLTGSILERALGENATRGYGESLVDRSRKGDFAVSRKGDRLIALKSDYAKSPAQPQESQQSKSQQSKSQQSPPDDEQSQGEQRAASLAREGVERQAIAPVSPNPAATAAQSAEEPSQPAAEIRGYSQASGGEYRVASVSPQNSKTAYPVLAPSRQDGKSIAGDAGSESGVRPVASFATVDVGPALRASRLYFSIDPMGQKLAALEPWAPGEEPQFEDFNSGERRDIAFAGDPLSRPATATDELSFKLASLPPDGLRRDDDGMFLDAPVERADLPPIYFNPIDKDEAGKGGETVAPKGQVTGEDKHPMSPAERLKLDEKSRAKAEKCLAEAVYFEARGETALGQVAVAQVVLNRAFSGKYPSTVCGVVYQNSHRHLACQFTFACDGIRDVIREPDMWERAKKIAAEMLDGKLWLPEVGKATHYHATYVHPGWVREMKKMHRLGVHIFYRPRAWGDGGDAPEWSDPETTQSVAKSL
jgi:spore germination cell wall hydrolase CwlJ-like protein